MLGKDDRYVSLSTKDAPNGYSHFVDYISEYRH